MLARSLFPSQIGAVSEANKAGEDAYKQEAMPGAAGDVARMVGNVAATAPIAYAMPGAAAPSLAARMLSGAASGAASGALQPVDVAAPAFWQQTGHNALTSGVAGAAAPAVLGGLARMVNPNAVERVAPLRERGVIPTVGQTVGGALGRTEEGLSSIPGPGDFIRSGRLRAINQFNEGAINDVLAPIGERLEGGVTGRDAIAQMADKVSGSYMKAVPGAGGILDQQALNDLTNLRQMAKFMPEKTAEQFDRIMKGMVLDKVAPNGGMTGESFKEAESDLGKIVRDHLYSPGATAAERQLGGAARELQSKLRQWLERVNPESSAEIGNANSAYARLLRVENAATRGNSMEPGTFTPSQLLAGVKKYSTDRQFSEGRALGQKYAEAGKDILGDKVPDSGTPLRYLLGTLTAGLMGGGVLPAGATSTLMGLAGGAAGAGAMYSPLGQRALAWALSARPPGAAPAAEALRNLGPGASTLAPWFVRALSP